MSKTWKAPWTRSPVGCVSLVYHKHKIVALDLGLPCLWYDTETKRCKHYNHRPEICRDFEMNGEDCIRLREKQGVRL